MDQNKKDGIATIRHRYQRRTRSISMAGFTALVLVTVAIATFVAFFD